MVWVGREVFIKEDAVCAFPSTSLERERDEIAEAALGKGVLFGKEPVVGAEPDVGMPFHPLGEKERSQLPRDDGRDGIREKEPDVCPVSRSGPFEGEGQTVFPAGSGEGKGPVLPAVPVKVHSQKVAGLVEKHGIDAHDEVLAPCVPSAEMPVHRLVGDRQKATAGTIEAFDPGLFANTSHPFVGASGLIA